MVIDPNSPLNISTQANKSKVQAKPSEPLPAGPNSLGKNDNTGVSLSDTAKTLSNLEKTIQAAPDVDIDKVNALKVSINSGNYSVNSTVIAEKFTQL